MSLQVGQGCKTCSQRVDPDRACNRTTSQWKGGVRVPRVVPLSRQLLEQAQHLGTVLAWALSCMPTVLYIVFPPLIQAGTG